MRGSSMFFYAVGIYLLFTFFFFWKLFYQTDSCQQSIQSKPTVHGTSPFLPNKVLIRNRTIRPLDESREKIFFIRIQKTGSKSLEYSLRRNINFLSGVCGSKFNNKHKWLGAHTDTCVERGLEVVRGDVKCLTAHHCDFDSAKRASMESGKNMRYVALIRHPVTRTLSEARVGCGLVYHKNARTRKVTTRGTNNSPRAWDYVYDRLSVAHPVLDCGDDDFMVHFITRPEHSKGMVMRQTKMLTGWNVPSNMAQSIDNYTFHAMKSLDNEERNHAANIAIRVIDSELDIVMVTELYQLSIAVLHRQLGYGIPSYYEEVRERNEEGSIRFGKKSKSWKVAEYMNREELMVYRAAIIRLVSDAIQLKLTPSPDEVKYILSQVPSRLVPDEWTRRRVPSYNYICSKQTKRPYNRLGYYVDRICTLHTPFS